MLFQDRRDVDGLVLPYRITTVINDRVVDEMIFDEIIVNPELSVEEFTRQATLKRPLP
jgi:hypothetical protein